MSDEEPTCFDAIELSDVAIQGYIRENIDNIVLGREGKFYCYSRKRMYKDIEDLKNISVACKEGVPDGVIGVRSYVSRRDVPWLFRIVGMPYAAYMTEADLKMITEDTLEDEAVPGMFILTRELRTVPRVQSFNVLLGSDWIGANHCNSGSSFTLYKVEPVYDRRFSYTSENKEQEAAQLISEYEKSTSIFQKAAQKIINQFETTTTSLPSRPSYAPSRNRSPSPPPSNWRGSPSPPSSNWRGSPSNWRRLLE